MNYYGPRQRKSDGKYHYTCMNDGQIWPVGFCADGCPGHDTAEQACEHQKQYMLSIARFGQKTDAWPKHKCGVQGCESEATCWAMIPGEMRQFEVCESHANKEALATLIEVGESISS